MYLLGPHLCLRDNIKIADTKKTVLFSVLDFWILTRMSYIFNSTFLFYLYNTRIHEPLNNTTTIINDKPYYKQPIQAGDLW